MMVLHQLHQRTNEEKEQGCLVYAVSLLAEMTRGRVCLIGRKQECELHPYCALKTVILKLARSLE